MYCVVMYVLWCVRMVVSCESRVMAAMTETLKLPNQLHLQPE